MGIGMNLRARLSHWTECHLEVLAIGDDFLFGKIVDSKDPSIKRTECILPLDLDWEFSHVFEE